MTAPRRALSPARPTLAELILEWVRTAWQPAAMAAVTCLLVAGFWPAPDLPPAPPAVPSLAEQVPSSSAPPETVTVASRPAPAHISTAPTPQPALRVDSLGIMAPLREVGVSDNALEIPADPGEVGLWSDGAAPGDGAGTVLVSGHVSWDGQRGALWSLAEAATDDVIELTDAGGTWTRWRIESVTARPRDAGHPDLFTRSGPHRLAVVTCGGPVLAGQYRDLVVVVAVPV